MPATAATWSRDRAARTPWCSTARTSRRSSTSPTAAAAYHSIACGSPAMSAVDVYDWHGAVFQAADSIAPTLRAADGNDALVGGSGGDLVDGGAGNDAVFLGAGDDTFEWNPDDGSDSVEGQDGFDTLVFN